MKKVSPVPYTGPESPSRLGTTIVILNGWLSFRTCFLVTTGAEPKRAGMPIVPCSNSSDFPLLYYLSHVPCLNVTSQTKKTAFPRSMKGVALSTYSDRVAKCKDPVFDNRRKDNKNLYLCVLDTITIGGTCCRMMAEWRSARLGECEVLAYTVVLKKPFVSLTSFWCLGFDSGTGTQRDKMCDLPMSKQFLLCFRIQTKKGFLGFPGGSPLPYRLAVEVVWANFPFSSHYGSMTLPTDALPEARFLTPKWNILKPIPGFAAKDGSRFIHRGRGIVRKAPVNSSTFILRS
ncbi:hypothetical protein ACFE04_019640 [Oxalis oulophora]